MSTSSGTRLCICMLHLHGFMILLHFLCLQDCNLQEQNAGNQPVNCWIYMLQLLAVPLYSRQHLQVPSARWGICFGHSSAHDTAHDTAARIKIPSLGSGSISMFLLHDLHLCMRTLRTRIRCSYCTCSCAADTWAPRRMGPHVSGTTARNCTGSPSAHFFQPMFG